MARTKQIQRSRVPIKPFKFEKGERVLVRHNSLIIHGKVEDQQIMHYNDNKNKYFIGLYEEGLNTKYCSRKQWILEEFVLKYDDASLTEEEELQVQEQVYLSNDQAISAEADGKKCSSSAGPSASNSSASQESNKRACDDLISTPNVKRKCESESSESEDSDSNDDLPKVVNSLSEPTNPCITQEEDPNVEEWVNYGRDFGKKVGKLDEDTRREIRYQMESILYNATKKN